MSRHDARIETRTPREGGWNLWPRSSIVTPTAVPTQLPAYKAGLLSHRGAHGRGKVGDEESDDDIRAAFERVEMAPMRTWSASTRPASTCR